MPTFTLKKYLTSRDNAHSHKSRLGIELGDVEVIVHACPIMGRQYVYGAQGKMTLEKQWNENPIAVPYQVVVDDLTVHNQDFIQFTSITDVYKPKSVCFMLGHPHYGAFGEVCALLFKHFIIQLYIYQKIEVVALDVLGL